MRLKLLLFLLTWIFFGKCLAEEISFETAASYKKNDQADFSKVKEGEKLKIERGDSIFVITKQSLPFLILAPNKSTSQITVSEANINAAILEQLKPSLEKNTNDIIDNLRKTESLIQRRDYTQASQIISSLKEKYRDISAVLFMSGTVNYLTNDKTTAIQDLERGLEIDPNNESAKKLLSKLKGGT